MQDGNYLPAQVFVLLKMASPEDLIPSQPCCPTFVDLLPSTKLPSSCSDHPITIYFSKLHHKQQFLNVT